MTTSTMATHAYEDLAAAVRGSVILPGDPEYDQARAVYNAMVDKRPAAIARCRDVADVITCVRFAREHDVEIAVRGGGHSAPGLGVWDDALVIDLSLLRSTTVSPEHHTVRADAGCTLADVDHATAAFGMAVPFGILGSTGVAGLTLGGGVGYLSRRFGLTVDNLLAAGVVVADGDLKAVLASEPHARNDVGDIAAPRDSGRALVDHGVVDGACLVILGIQGQDHAAAHGGGKILVGVRGHR